MALALVAVVLGLSAPNPVGAQVPDTTPAPTTTPATTAATVVADDWPPIPHSGCSTAADWTMTSDGLSCDPTAAAVTPSAPLVVTTTAMSEDTRDWVGLGLALRFLAALGALGIAIKRLVFD